MLTEIGIAQRRFYERRVVEDGVGETRTGEVGMAEVGVREISGAKVRPGQRGGSEIRIGEVLTREARAEKSVARSRIPVKSWF